MLKLLAVIMFTCKTMYNKTIIRFGFCDIWNNQGLGGGFTSLLVQSTELFPVSGC